MQKNYLLKQTLVFAIVVLFAGLIVVPSISSVSNHSKSNNIYTGTGSFNPFKEGWKYRKQITIDHTQVAGDLTSFPVLVYTIDSDLRDKAQDDGDDILFMDGKGEAEQLYHEIEYYDDSYGELAAWVNLPSISSDDDTIFYIYYNNSDCNAQQSPEEVWDSEYMMVLHMYDYPDSYHVKDSTVNHNDGIKKGYNEPYETIGKIGKAQNFDGYNDYIDSRDFDIDDDFTVSLWINPGSTHFDQCFIGKHSLYGDNLLIFGYVETGGEMGYALVIREHAHREGMMTMEWHYMVFVGDKLGSSLTRATVYEDGGVIWQYDLSAVVGNVLGKPWTIGNDHDTDGTRDDFYNGIIDEVRIINSIKSPEWVSTEYNNQNDPSSFLSFGDEEESALYTWRQGSYQNSQQSLNNFFSLLFHRLIEYRFVRQILWFHLE